MEQLAIEALDPKRTVSLLIDHKAIFPALVCKWRDYIHESTVSVATALARIVSIDPILESYEYQRINRYITELIGTSSRCWLNCRVS
jgi:hypothetical protein